MEGIITPEYQADELAHWAATAPLTEGILTPFGVIDPSRLSQDGAIDAVLAMQRLKAWADAQTARILAEAARHPEPVPAPRGNEREYALFSFQHEVACALRWSPNTAAGRFDVATTLVDSLPATLELLESGGIEEPHARHLVQTVQRLDDPTATITRKLEKRVLANAAKRTVSEFKRDVRRGLAALDPRGEDEKHAKSAEDRCVEYQPDEHAMAVLR
jgi:hypothetical protein